MGAKAAVKRLLRPFNVVLPVQPYGTRFKVPILRGVGGSHRHGSEPWMVDALRRLFQAGGKAGLIDVGVNIGQTLLKLRSVAPDAPYVGFEPNPFCIQFVNELVALNGFRDCTIVPVALAAAPGLVGFVADSEADSAASVVQDLRPGKPSIRRQYVATLKFDDIAADLAVADIPMVKIDVEGAELDVLDGMRAFLRERRPLVVCEVLHAHTGAQLALMRARNTALVALLADVGYAAYRIGKDEALAHVTGLVPVAAFPDEVYDPRTSPAVCDYLFVPHERVAPTLSAFG